VTFDRQPARAERALVAHVSSGADPELHDLLGHGQRPEDLVDRVGVQREQAPGGDRRLILVVGRLIVLGLAVVLALIIVAVVVAIIPARLGERRMAMAMPAEISGADRQYQREPQPT